MAAMTAWVISKKQGFYNGLTEEKGGVGVKADAVFYIAIGDKNSVWQIYDISNGLKNS